MFRSQKGLTLTELMIVVVIIGILATISIPNFIAMQNRKKEGGTKANMHAAQLAMEKWSVEHDGCYPKKLEELQTGALLNIENPWHNPIVIMFAIEPDTVTFAPRGAVRVSVFLDSDSNATAYRIRGGDHANRPLKLVLTSFQ